MGRIQDLPKWGWTMGSVECESIKGSRGTVPGRGHGDKVPLKLKAFCPFSHKRAGGGQKLSI